MFLHQLRRVPSQRVAVFTAVKLAFGYRVVSFRIISKKKRYLLYYRDKVCSVRIVLFVTILTFVRLSADCACSGTRIRKTLECWLRMPVH